MTSNQTDESGFSAVESILVVVIIAAIGLVGWYVYRARQNTNNLYNATNSSASPNFGTKKAVATGDTSNAALQSSLQDATSSANKGNQDMSTANNSLNDQSTLTSVPQ
jgi:predicted negative regulator of RcsB-dependent stress response